MYDTTYKGYLIRYHQPGDSWVAHIYRPGELRIMTGGVVTATWTRDHPSCCSARIVRSTRISLARTNPIRDLPKKRWPCRSARPRRWAQRRSQAHASQPMRCAQALLGRLSVTLDHLQQNYARSWRRCRYCQRPLPSPNAASSGCPSSRVAAPVSVLRRPVRLGVQNHKDKASCRGRSAIARNASGVAAIITPRAVA
jgi:hypothetical protein